MKGEVQVVHDVKVESGAESGDDDAGDNEPQVNAVGSASSSVVAPSTVPAMSLPRIAKTAVLPSMAKAATVPLGTMKC